MRGQVLFTSILGRGFESYPPLNNHSEREQGVFGDTKLEIFELSS